MPGARASGPTSRRACARSSRCSGRSTGPSRTPMPRSSPSSSASTRCSLRRCDPSGSSCTSCWCASRRTCRCRTARATRPLGLNLRAMVRAVHERHVLPEMPGIVAAFDAAREAARDIVRRELAERVFAPEPAPPRPSAWSRLLGRSPPVRDETPREQRALEAWKTRDAADALEGHCLAALVKLVESALAHRGRLPPDPELLERLAIDRVGNAHGAELIARLVAPMFERAVDAEGYRRLPVQPEPVVMNVKGASASGKSTTRPLQRKLAARLGIPWEDFALISPGLLAQVPPGLRFARSRPPLRRHADGPGAGARRREARSPHGRQGRRRSHVAPADRSLPLRQLRAGERARSARSAAIPASAAACSCSS